MPVTRSRSGTLQIATPRHATCYRLAQWLGEISGEIFALDRSINIAHVFRRSTTIPQLLTRERDSWNQLFIELRGVLHLPRELQISSVLELVVESLVEIYLGLFRHPDDPPGAEGDEVDSD